MTWLIVFCIVFVAIGVAGWVWRLNLMVNHPEKYRAYREAEKEFAESQAASTKAIAQGAVGAAKAGAEIVGKLLK